MTLSYLQLIDRVIINLLIIAKKLIIHHQAITNLIKIFFIIKFFDKIIYFLLLI